MILVDEILKWYFVQLCIDNGKQLFDDNVPTTSFKANLAIVSQLPGKIIRSFVLNVTWHPYRKEK